MHVFGVGVLVRPGEAYSRKGAPKCNKYGETHGLELAQFHPQARSQCHRSSLCVGQSAVAVKAGLIVDLAA